MLVNGYSVWDSCSFDGFQLTKSFPISPRCLQTVRWASWTSSMIPRSYGMSRPEIYWWFCWGPSDCFFGDFLVYTCLRSSILQKEMSHSMNIAIWPICFSWYFCDWTHLDRFWDQKNHRIKKNTVVWYLDIHIGMVPKMFLFGWPEMSKNQHNQTQGHNGKFFVRTFAGMRFFLGNLCRIDVSNEKNGLFRVLVM